LLIKIRWMFSNKIAWIIGNSDISIPLLTPKVILPQKELLSSVCMGVRRLYRHLWIASWTGDLASNAVECWIIIKSTFGFYLRKLTTTVGCILCWKRYFNAYHLVVLILWIWALSCWRCRLLRLLLWASAFITLLVLAAAIALALCCCCGWHQIDWILRSF